MLAILPPESDDDRIIDLKVPFYLLSVTKIIETRCSKSARSDYSLSLLVAVYQLIFEENSFIRGKKGGQDHPSVITHDGRF